ncbi:mitochondrial enolase superfamily member 1 [Grus japonensis]|uniref:Mitochondrial enolase superfamily member 1 n=1 Tax=Grus japonensis TaxID=30415 RepID=A0ABC9Y9U4_GRUJA
MTFVNPRTLRPYRKSGARKTYPQWRRTRSWRLGEVPGDWRKVNVTPIFKKGKKENPGNYRLVSLTSVLGKVMEQLILETISRHMKNKKVIRSSQHGFTKVKGEISLIAYDEIPLQGLLSLKRVNSTSQFSIISKFANGAFNSCIQITDKNIEQNWP